MIIYIYTEYPKNKASPKSGIGFSMPKFIKNSLTLLQAHHILNSTIQIITYLLKHIKADPGSLIIFKIPDCFNRNSSIFCKLIL